MANGVKKIMKARNRKRTQGGRNSPVPTVNRSQSRISDAKQRRSDNTANPRKSFERYSALAREAAASGNAIESENYYQHAEHYLRQIASS